MRSFRLSARSPVYILLFLSLLGIGATAAAKHTPRRVEVKIEDLKFKPASIDIGPGDTVVWVNNDDTDHNLKADDDSFNSGRLASGRRYEHKFDKAGKIEYHDDLHPRLHGVVVVSDQ